MSASGGGVENPEPEQELKSIITLYIVSHGIDMPNSPFNDPSVRILSQAGKFGCYGFFNNIEISQITQWFNLLETTNQDPNKSTYSTLEQIKQTLQTENNKHLGKFDYKQFLNYYDWKLFYKYFNETAKTEKKEKTLDFRQSRHTGKTIDANEDWQIYSPIMDHDYDFTDSMFPNQGIFIVDIKNKPASFKFTAHDNLFKIMNQTKYELKQMKIKDFLLKHKIFDDDKTIIDMTNNLSKNEVDDLNLFILSLNNVYTTNDLASILGIEAVNKIKKIIVEEYRDKFILQSKLVKFLKDAGFDIINIIDRSCRAYGEIMSKEEFAKINAKRMKHLC